MCSSDLVNIYRASRRIQELLQELADLAGGRRRHTETCKLAELIEAACDALAHSLAGSNITVYIDIPRCIDVVVERGRV